MAHPGLGLVRPWPLALAVSLALLGGCDEPSRDSGAPDPRPASLGADPGRASFKEVVLPADGTLGADPATLAQALLGAREPMEGLYSETSKSLAESADLRVLLFTQMDLPDDSVRGMRHRLEARPEAGGWRLVWAGRQVQCRAGRGHEGWGIEPCL